MRSHQLGSFKGAMVHRAKPVDRHARGRKWRLRRAGGSETEEGEGQILTGDVGFKDAIPAV